MAKMNQAMTDLLRYNSAILPQKRSSFNKSHSHTTTMDSGYIIPVMWDRVLPGDEKKIRYSGLARMATPIFPTMDEAYLDVWAFYVPDRLWWNHAKEFYGENLDASFNPDGEYVMPTLKPSQYYVGNFANKNIGIGSLNDYLGMPIIHSYDLNTLYELDENDNMKITAGLHRSYQLIWNDWFRNSSIQPALQLNTGDTVSSDEADIITRLRLANKLPDYFMTLLRSPQSGGDVSLPLAEWSPVVTRPVNVDEDEYYKQFGFEPNSNGEYYFRSPYGLNFANKLDMYGNFDYSSGANDLIVRKDGALKAVDGEVPGGTMPTLAPTNLWANLSSSSATINNLRQAITIQQLLEIDSLGGKRYQQILHAHFGVITPDATLQRPELLGATRVNIGMRQVLQTSSSNDISPQGNVSGVSVTNIDNEWICNKAFTEPGFIMVLATVRPLNSYSQGVDCLLRKLNRYDHYWPVFDNLGNQPVYASEIYASVNDNGNLDVVTDNFDRVLGYKEAWTEYRTKMNRVSGLMRPDVNGSLGAWNYSNNFDFAPYLSSSFIQSDPELIDRTIAVPSEPQFILDSYFDYIDIKNMGVHSVPGLTRL